MVVDVRNCGIVGLFMAPHTGGVIFDVTAASKVANSGGQVGVGYMFDGLWEVDAFVEVSPFVRDIVGGVRLDPAQPEEEWFLLVTLQKFNATISHPLCAMEGFGHKAALGLVVEQVTYTVLMLNVAIAIFL